MYISPSETPFTMTKTVQHRIDRAKNPQTVRRRRKCVVQSTAVVPTPKPSLSPATRERLLAEAMTHARLQWMTPEEITAWVDGLITAYLAKQPFWFGQTPSADAQHRSNLRQHRVKHGLEAAGEQPAHLRRENLPNEFTPNKVEATL